MNQHLQEIKKRIEQQDQLDQAERDALLKLLANADKQWSITDFKLDRTEKVKRTTAILLEETIAELEQKRIAIEKQYRELEVEASLERVRSRSMGMQRSHELKDIIQVLYDQLIHLGFNTEHAGFIMDYKDRQDMSIWLADKHNVPSKIDIPYFDSPHWNSFVEAKETGKDFFANFLDFETKNKFYNDLFALIPGLADEARNYYLSCPGVAISTVLMDNVGLYVENFTPVPYTDEENATLMRFGKVFQQTYTRFMDLQKAEAQAREALIEAALEKVRSRSLAMHSSKEIKDVVRIAVEKIIDLNIEMNGGVSIVTFEPGNKDLLHWILIPEKMDETFTAELPWFDHIMFKDCDDARNNGTELIAKIYSGKIKDDYFNHIFRQSGFRFLTDETKSWVMDQPYFGFSYAIQKHSGIFLNDYTGKYFSNDTNDILVRFSRVFEQAYVRFLDLQKAEKQSKEAQIETALERVRSRTLAMHKSDELAETAAEVFRQLKGLGIELNRLYIGIVRGDDGDIEMWATDETGEHISQKFTFNKNENASVFKLFEGWKAKLKSMVVDMQGDELADYLYYLKNTLKLPVTGAADQRRRLQSVAYFSQGFIGMASTEEISPESIFLLERFAAVFNLTFARFNDLKIAEAHAVQAEQDLIEIKAARKKAEEALTELQLTQNQLIQKEKMASLGELTAGIAHEIQNPLNFVNNFSEVSGELLEEAVGRRQEAGENSPLVNELLTDIKENLSKINHHGKRADAIVKGMLQHSRTTTGVKEPTDLNALVDEYITLAYHGYRGKDNSFEVSITNEFDPAVGMAEVSPGEMGRFLLNVLTNAFYAVREKQKLLQQSGESKSYIPQVSVITKKKNRQVEVSVTDNGIGIPDKIIPKIFQPFFTTKPTGQGTGLGLSLAYDIVKAHSGELTVTSAEGSGSTFTITLPA